MSDHPNLDALFAEIAEANESLHPTIAAEPWGVFRDRAEDDVPMLVERIWPEGGMGFIGAAPKAGKTWVALLLAIAAATGEPFLGEFHVPEPVNVLYVALEGTRQGMRARVGGLARGMGIDPDGDALDNIHFAYKPPGMNLSDPAWAVALVEHARALEARLIIVDVLRRAASVQEDGKGATDFAALIRNLAGLEADGRALVWCHHFTKPGETQKGRKGADRMAGSGALYGALDAGLFLTSEDNATTIRVEVEARDIRAPKPFQVYLTGAATGPNGGWTYRDAIHVEADLGDIKSPEDVMVEQLVQVLTGNPGITKENAAAKVGTTRHQATFMKAWPVAQERCA